MSFITSPSKKTEIYSLYLSYIGGMKFTFREIEIISCVLNNRTEKKIAALLSIAPRTVSAHIHNIINKLGGSSRESIIDFAQNSGKLAHLREYYFHILVEIAFKQKLSSIAKLIGPGKNILYNVYFNLTNCEENSLFSYLVKYLLIANIKLKSEASAKTLAPPIGEKSIRIVSNKITEAEGLPDRVVLLLNKHNSNRDIKESGSIDFSTDDIFYFSVFQLIEQLVQIPKIEEIISKFKDEYHIIQNSWDGVTPLPPPQSSNDNSVQITKIPKQNLLKIRISIFILVAGMVIIFIKLSGHSFSSILFPKKVIAPVRLEQDKEIKLFLTLVRNNEISANNILNTQKAINYSYAKSIEQVIHPINNSKIRSYLYSPAISPVVLLDVVYTFHALSSYYMYNDHDGIKAREILFYAKDLLENYISTHSNIKLSFAELDKDELYTEFSIIKDMPEMYARILYALGRTYIYQGSKQEALKYFEIARYFGAKTNIFEAYLSVISGTEVVKYEEIENQINNGNYKDASYALQQSIALYKKFKTEDKTYKSDYKPNIHEQEIKNLSTEAYNQALLGERIIKYYNTLIQIAPDISHKSQYLQAIICELNGTSIAPGVLEQSRSLSPKSVASLYNLIGSVILNLYNSGVDLLEFQNSITEKLNLSSKESLDIAYDLFRLSKSLSRKTDFTKADAYNGIAKVYRKKIDTQNLSETQIKEMEVKILESQTKRDKINLTLKRSVTSNRR